MKHYLSSAELKDRAKANLTEKYGASILVILMVYAISGLLTQFAALFIPTNITGIILSMVLSLAISIVVGMLNPGICLFFLNAACGEPYRIDNIFYGFQERTKVSFTISAALAALDFVCLMPSQFCLILFLNTGIDSFLRASVITLIIGLLFYVPVNLSLSLSFFLMLDFPQYEAKEIMQMSRKIMKGSKRRLFYLEMSFLPLCILCTFTCFIGFLWLIPYMKMTKVCFFLNIMNPDSGRQ